MKNLKDLFPDIDTCKKLATTDKFDNSAFIWVNGEVEKRFIQFEKPSYFTPAPTTDEILEVLPKSLTGFYFLRMLINSIGQFICFYANDCDDLTANHKIQYDTYNNSPVQALAELLLKLKEKNLLPL